MSGSLSWFGAWERRQGLSLMRQLAKNNPNCATGASWSQNWSPPENSSLALTAYSQNFEMLKQAALQWTGLRSTPVYANIHPVGLNSQSA